MIARIRPWPMMAAILLAACASGPPDGERLAPVADPTGMPALAELPTQQLARGQCALALWSRNATPVRFVVTLDQPAVARVGRRLLDERSADEIAHVAEVVHRRDEAANEW